MKEVEVIKTTIYDCKRTLYFKINLDDYKDWLDGREHSDDELDEYLNDYCDPYDIDEEYDDVDTIIECNELDEII